VNLFDNYSNPSDSSLLIQVEKAIYRQSKGQKRFREQIPLLLRKAVDEVIDSPRSKRFTIDEIEKTEKTYLGTKVEILLRNFLQFPKGKILDLEIDGIEVDIKNTIGATWTIPGEAMGHVCILLQLNEEKALYSFGLVEITAQVLTSSPNRDQKLAISAEGKKSIRWLVHEGAYPENFWQRIKPEWREQIISEESKTARLAMLFRLVQRQPISRSLIEGIAQQKDPLKRLRFNGGARDILMREGIILLSGQQHREEIQRRCLPACKPDEFISCAEEVSADYVEA